MSITPLITIAIESGRFGVTQASVEPLVKEVNIKDSGELIVIEKFVERFKSGITQLTTGENKKAPATMFNKVSESNLTEVCAEINDYFKKGRHGHKPNLYEIAYIFSTAFIEAYHYSQMTTKML